ncbi:MAG: leucine-rich repeat domain-containing protein [Desulfuromonadales bacterium]
MKKNPQSDTAEKFDKKEFAKLKKLVTSSDPGVANTGVALLQTLGEPAYYNMLLEGIEELSLRPDGETDCSFGSLLGNIREISPKPEAEQGVLLDEYGSKTYCENHELTFDTLLKLISQAPESCEKITKLKAIVNTVQTTYYDDTGSCLSSFRRIIRLELNGSDSLTDISDLAKFTDIKYLILRNFSSLTDISPLTGLTNLARLNLPGCSSLSDLKPLSGLTNLRTLDFRSCSALTDLSPLSGLVNLINLDLRYCEALTDLSPLAGLTKLNNLDVTQGCESLKKSSIKKLKKILPNCDLIPSTLQKTIQKLVDGKRAEHGELLLLAKQRDLEKIEQFIYEADAELDHVCESFFDQVTSSLAEFTPIDRETIIKDIRYFWLMIDDASRGHARIINEFAAMAIAAYNKSTGITLEGLAELADSKVWQERMVAGYTIHDLGDAAPDGSQALREKLEKDTFCDEDDVPRVRKAVGITLSIKDLVIDLSVTWVRRYTFNDNLKEKPSARAIKKDVSSFDATLEDFPFSYEVKNKKVASARIKGDEIRLLLTFDVIITIGSESMKAFDDWMNKKGWASWEEKEASDRYNEIDMFKSVESLIVSDLAYAYFDNAKISYQSLMEATM